ncbi:hypothetical protein SDC9_89754 [bioreactor metagenome]|uniref:Uncharacterized protein n=1 Tax=bioreactor metagenome TaxID=1076179 RepID=A0A644ZT52_9ZZZZ
MDQPLHDDLAQDAQRCAQVMALGQQRVTGLRHGVARGHAGWQKRHFRFVAPMQALEETGMFCEMAVAIDGGRF